MSLPSIKGRLSELLSSMRLEDWRRTGDCVGSCKAGQSYLKVFGPQAQSNDAIRFVEHAPVDIKALIEVVGLYEAALSYYGIPGGMGDAGLKAREALADGRTILKGTY